MKIGGKDSFDIMQKGVQSFSEMCSRQLLGSFLHTLKFNFSIFFFYSKLECDVILWEFKKAMWINSTGEEHTCYLIIDEYFPEFH